jgi:hypothetical protein
VTLFRRGRIDQTQLDRQLDAIEHEESELRQQIAAARARAHAAADAQASLNTAETWLIELNRKLDQPVSWALKRQTAEALVPTIRVHTEEREGKRVPRVVITYAFGATVNCTDIRAVYHCTVQRTLAAVRGGWTDL